MVCTIDPNKLHTQKLLLLCPEGVSNQFSNPSISEDWFEEVEGDRYLILFVTPENYKPIRSENKQEYQDTIVGGLAPLQTVRVGFEAKIEDQYMDRLYLVEQLAYNCTSPDLLSHTPLQLLDYVRPEIGDRKLAANGLFYTLRRGRISEIQEQGGSVAKTGGRFSQGFTIHFVEHGRRRLLG